MRELPHLTLQLSAHLSRLNEVCVADAIPALAGPAASVPLLVQAFGGVAFVGVSGVGSCYLLFDNCNLRGNSANSATSEQVVVMDGALQSWLANKVVRQDQTAPWIDPRASSRI